MIDTVLKKETANNILRGGDIVDNNRKNNDFGYAKSSYEDVRSSQDSDLKDIRNSQDMRNSKSNRDLKNCQNKKSF